MVFHRANGIQCMTEKSSYTIAVQVESRFVSEQSQPADNRYVFAYTIVLRNAGSVPARLLARHWVITDANGKIEEVEGEGVVGEQPWMRPGERYEYTSGAILETAVGTMRGSYQMIADDGTEFDAPIPQFTLSIPRTLH
jgi:ApaG protein